jgi:DmsE family decaheme c-type cytochrome
VTAPRDRVHEPVVRRATTSPTDPDREAAKADFVGSDACSVCHMDREASLRTSFHDDLLTGHLGSIGCEECHGPGIDHVGDGEIKFIRHPGKAPHDASNATCLRCHEAVLTTPVRGHPDWVDERELRCVTCHRVHLNRDDRDFRLPVEEAHSVADLVRQGAEPVMADRCIRCHPDYHPEMPRSGHRDLAKDDGCAQCHGPGSLHAFSGGRKEWILEPTEQEATEADRSCNECHKVGEDPLLRWTCSEHKAEGVSCVTCHDPNAGKGKTLRKADPALCAECHADVAAEFRLPSRHRVLEGDLKCSDCHDPHGNEAGFHRFDLTRDGCSKCHFEKAGPFVHDHVVKTQEGCVACHRPHGSPNKRLLETAEIRTLCLSCHPALPLSHEQRAGSPYRHCIDCHSEIHGSDVDRNFIR